MSFISAGERNSIIVNDNYDGLTHNLSGEELLWLLVLCFDELFWNEST